MARSFRVHALPNWWKGVVGSGESSGSLRWQLAGVYRYGWTTPEGLEWSSAEILSVLRRFEGEGT